MSARRKRAGANRTIAVCKSVELACPHCDGDVPAPDGSLYWTVEELRAVEGEKRSCPACDEPITLTLPSSVRAA